MSTIYPFIPPTQAPYQFQPTLDNNVYTGIVTWLAFGQRLYISLYAQDGTRVFTLPLIGSTAGVALKALSWSNGIVTAQTVRPHGYKITDTIRITLSESLPAAYNGIVSALIIAPDKMQWTVAANPGIPTLLGHVDYDVNLAAGYFATSTLVFNEDSQQIEVTP